MSRMNINGCIGDLTPFPGCGQIVVSHNVFLPPEHRGQGKVGKAHKERLNVMRDLGYDYALATVLRSNEKERAILASNGWRILSAFQSTRSLEDILIYGRQIEKKNDRSVAQPVGAEYYDHVDQRQQFQNVDREDGDVFCSGCSMNILICECKKTDLEPTDKDGFPIPYTNCKGKTSGEIYDAETAIHEEIQRVRQET